jgi:hypothetical protein
MSRGGARVNPGPTPDPGAFRRDRPADKESWTMLPSEGRKGNAPAWPLAKWRDMEKSKPADEQDGASARKIDDRELMIWRQIWKTPQATQWARMGWTYDVGLYVRMMVGGETGNMKAAQEARFWSDRLGLTQASMLRNRWKIMTDEVGEKRQATRAAAKPPSSRDRFHVVRSGVGT